MTDAEIRTFDALTSSERHIVMKLMNGARNRDIANVLGKTEQTVKNQMRRIFDKTGMGNRVELALFIQAHPNLLHALRVVTLKSDGLTK